MEELFWRVVDDNFSELAGLSVQASIPVSEQLANELIAAALQGSRELTYCHVQIGRENHIRLAVKSPRWPWPLHLKLHLFGSLDFTGSPTVRAFLENNVLLGRLGALFKALPPGIKIYADQVSVDIGTFLNSPEQKRLLELVKAVEIKTEEGKIVFDVKIKR